MQETTKREGSSSNFALQLALQKLYVQPPYLVDGAAARATCMPQTGSICVATTVVAAPSAAVGDSGRVCVCDMCESSSAAAVRLSCHVRRLGVDVAADGHRATALGVCERRGTGPNFRGHLSPAATGTRVEPRSA
jgi:hypothetical protein